MDIESYKQAAVYKHVFFKDEEFYSVKVVVWEMLNTDRYSIDYSHTFIPIEGAGVYHSDSFAHADSIAHAEAKVKMFLGDMLRSYKIVEID